MQVSLYFMKYPVYRYLTKHVKLFAEYEQKLTGIGCQEKIIETQSNNIRVLSHSNATSSGVSGVCDGFKLTTPKGIKGLSALVILVKRLGNNSVNSDSNNLQQNSLNIDLECNSKTKTNCSSLPLPLRHQNNSFDSSFSSNGYQLPIISSIDKQSLINTIDSLNTNLKSFESSTDLNATPSNAETKKCDKGDFIKQLNLNPTTTANSDLCFGSDSGNNSCAITSGMRSIRKRKLVKTLLAALNDSRNRLPLSASQSHVLCNDPHRNVGDCDTSAHPFFSLSNGRLLYLSQSKNLHIYYLKRNFKANRKPFLGMGTDTRYSDSANKNRSVLGSIFNEDSKIGSVFRSKKRMNETEKLKSLLNEENLNNNEQQRLKVAFAEGYLAAEPKTRASAKLRVFNIIRDLLGIVVIIAIFISFMGELSGGSFRRVLIGRNNEVRPEEIDVTFDDVKGVDEAKQELMEIVEFLRNPEKFSSLGGKLPKGVLLVGPPGTGKTLLARAVAGEAGVPFFHAAGPEFDEILVGQGARRVRDLFSTAKQRAPCVVFIDEIDSVGAKRSNSVLHPYANQTINQLLTEMDGFRQNEGVIVLGATNRHDDLDRALLRPGRFDVEVQVSVPDLNGRKEILQLYLGKVKLANDVDIDVLARGTTGFTGADLENLVNQAALRAAIDGKDSVTTNYLENSRDKVLMGPERRSRIPDEEANIITAYHEGGHALVAHYTKDSSPLHKVTIIPRGPSLGHTAYIPEKESYHVTKSQLLATMDTLMGGRAAEELIFGLDKVTTGAADDLKKATTLATHMVKDLGMSEKIGVRTFDEEHTALVVVNDLAVSTAETIDSEIKKILQESYERAKSILRNHSREHKLLAEALLKHETLNAEDVKSLIYGKETKL